MKAFILSISSVVLSLASVASIISLVFIQGLPFLARVVITLIALIALGILLLRDYFQNQSNKRVCHTDQEIKEAMKDIIQSPGTICIMSRDLSWVDNEIKNCLLTKRESVLIFAENPTPITQELQNGGVTIKYYGPLSFRPKTRFTILRYNKLDPQVAIANTENTIRKKHELCHTIYQTLKDNSIHDQWINALAIDMVSLCDLACERISDEKNSI